MEFIGYLALFIVLIQLIRYFLVVRQLQNVRMQRAGTALRDCAEAPAYLQPLFDAAERELAGLGFKLSHCQLSEELYCAGNMNSRWQRVYLHEERATYAVLSASQLPDAGYPYNVDFVTILSDGRRLQTLNGLSHTVMDSVPNTVINDPSTELLAKQWESHLGALAGLTRDRAPVRLDPGEFAARDAAAKQAYFDHLMRKGMIRSAEAGFSGIAPAAVARFALKVVAGMGKAASLQTRRMKLAKTLPAPALPVETEVQGFLRMDALAKSKGRKWQGEALMLFGSLALFTLSFGYDLSLESLLIIIMAVALHEVGHLVGMALFGYEDVKLLFVPFVGAAAIGTPKRATPFQKVVVALLGPAPGALIGAYLLGASAHPAVTALAAGLLAINYFNLLPIMPFDGGHVLQDTLFLRFPALQAVFWVLSSLAMAALAMALSTPVLFGIAVFLLLSALPQFRNSQALMKFHKRRAGRAGGETAEEETLREIFLLLREKPYLGMPFAGKYQLAKHLRDNAAAGMPSLGTIALALVLYAALFITPLAMVAAWLFSLRFFGM